MDNRLEMFQRNILWGTLVVDFKFSLGLIGKVFMEIWVRGYTFMDMGDCCEIWGGMGWLDFGFS